MVKNNRWQKAQDAELDFVVSENIDFINAAFWESTLNNDFGISINDNNFWMDKVIEIGCGLRGMIHFINGKKKIGCDPLVYKFREQGLASFQGTLLVCAVGEEIPFKPDSFDVVVLYNVLDHTNNPSKVLDEIFRVIKPGGKLLFSLFTISGISKPIRLILNILDREHPYHFISAEAMLLIESSGFKCIYEKTKKRKAYSFWPPHLFSLRYWKHLVAKLIHYHMNVIAIKP